MAQQNEGGPKNEGAPKNEGEGNRTAAREYNKASEAFAKSGKVDKAAHDAERAVEGAEGEELRRAEEAGKRHSHGEDPKLKGGAGKSA